MTSLMTGGTGAGSPMWNIVKLGGKNYLVDVTNSDPGSVGQDGLLFLAKADSGSVAAGYVFIASGEEITYTYDEGLIWGNDVLTLAMEGPVASITGANGDVTTYTDFDAPCPPGVTAPP